MIVSAIVYFTDGLRRSFSKMAGPNVLIRSVVERTNANTDRAPKVIGKLRETDLGFHKLHALPGAVCGVRVNCADRTLFYADVAGLTEISNPVMGVYINVRKVLDARENRAEAYAGPMFGCNQDPVLSYKTLSRPLGERGVQGDTHESVSGLG